ncbi:MAG: DUF5674 family protein [Candidatus Omnitrophica bacterium]|nr:DUF5674 family protein [Candidatus Omnitrophota bacterium]
MEIVKENIPLEKVKQMANKSFGDLVKAVVDVERRVIAMDGELHSDLEALLLSDGSQQKDLWGINIYPYVEGEGFIEFDSLINIRPSQGNRSYRVEDEVVRKKIITIVKEKIIQ